jgi:hypothetical protein
MPGILVNSSIAFGKIMLQYDIVLATSGDGLTTDPTAGTGGAGGLAASAECGPRVGCIVTG